MRDVSVVMSPPVVGMRPTRGCGVMPGLAARQPLCPARVQRLDLRARQTRHVALDVVADALLEIGEVAVALGVAGEDLRVEVGGLRRIDRVETILLVDRLANDDPPPAVSA